MRIPLKHRWRLLVAIAGIMVMTISLAFWNIACSVVGIRTWEEHSYADVVTDGRFSVRLYEPAIVAKTVVSADTPKPGSVMFSRLGGYIGGKNVSKKSIEMTVPVVREANSRKIEMTVPVVRTPLPDGYLYAFVMPAKYDMASLPRPTDPNVKLQEWPSRLVAVYRFSGISDEADLATHGAELKDWLKKAGYRATAEPRLAYYDPPWTIPFLRRNEVQVTVEQPGPK